MSDSVTRVQFNEVSSKNKDLVEEVRKLREENESLRLQINGQLFDYIFSSPPKNKSQKEASEAGWFLCSNEERENLQRQVNTLLEQKQISKHFILELLQEIFQLRTKKQHQQHSCTPSPLTDNHILPHHSPGTTSLIDFVYEWHGGGTHVLLAGSFNEWKGCPMVKKDNKWRTIYKLSPGVYEYKVIVDGVWRVDEAHPSVRTSEGIINNVVVIGWCGFVLSKEGEWLLLGGRLVVWWSKEKDMAMFVRVEEGSYSTLE